jgi:hypothetical protein
VPIEEEEEEEEEDGGGGGGGGSFGSHRIHHQGVITCT